MTIPTVALDENAPAGNTDLNLGDNRIREYKTQNREVMEVDHDFPSAGNSLTAGQHKKVTLQEQVNLGTGAVGTTLLGSQTVSGKGELVYTDEDDNDVVFTKNGKLNGAALDIIPSTILTTILNAVYPVGSVVTLGVATNPATLFGIGTWSAITGRVIVGFDAGQTEFDALDETGGEKTHLLTAAESGLVSHKHGTPAGQNGGSTFSGSQLWSSGATQFGAGGDSETIAGANAASAHNNLQPYQVKYIWQRTA